MRLSTDWSFLRQDRIQAWRQVHPPYCGDREVRWSIGPGRGGLLAGFGFAASANTAAGTDPAQRHRRTPDVVAERAAVVDPSGRTKVTDLQVQEWPSWARSRRAQRPPAPRAPSCPVGTGGLVPLTGPAVSVTPTDAPAEGNEEANPDDLVVHQQDLQADQRDGRQARKGSR